MIKTTLAYIRQENKTLLLYRNKRKDDIHFGKYVGVGGKFEEGEEAEDCLVREVFEETGLYTVSHRLRGTIDFPNFDGKNDIFCYIFTIDEFFGTLSNCEEGELKWVDNSKITSLPMWEGDSIFLDWLYNRSDYFKAIFNYKDKKLIDYSVDFGGEYEKGNI